MSAVSYCENELCILNDNKICQDANVIALKCQCRNNFVNEEGMIGEVREELEKVKQEKEELQDRLDKIASII